MLHYHQKYYFFIMLSVVVNRERHRIDCAKNAMGVNLRLYHMDKLEYSLGNLIGDFKNDWKNHNVWRDVWYYMYMRDNVLLKKKSPNFLMMYSYHVAEDYYVDFSGLQSVVEKYTNKKYPIMWQRHRNFVLRKYKEMLENEDNLNKLDNGLYFGFMTVNKKSGIKFNYNNIDNLTPRQLENIKNQVKIYKERIHAKYLRNTWGKLPHEIANINHKYKFGEHAIAENIEDELHGKNIDIDSNRMLVVLTESQLIHFKIGVHDYIQ